MVSSLDEGGFRSALSAEPQPGTEFWVARGRYRGQPWNRSCSRPKRVFRPEDGCRSLVAVRRPRRASPGANVTVLTGDIELNDTVNGDEVTLNSSNIAGSNSYTVVKASGVSHGDP